MTRECKWLLRHWPDTKDDFGNRGKNPFYYTVVCKLKNCFMFTASLHTAYFTFRNRNK
jgi:hypothetical protein